LKRVQLRCRILVAEPNSKDSVNTGAFLVPSNSHLGLRPRLFAKAHPSGAALKRVQLHCRVLVAEPNSRTRPSSRFFIACGLSPGTAPQVIRQGSPLPPRNSRIKT